MKARNPHARAAWNRRPARIPPRKGKGSYTRKPKHKGADQ